MSRILAVDDEKDFLELISFSLRRCGHEVIAVLDGLEGLNYARRNSPDLIVTDVWMPGMDGFSLCESLRRQPLTSAIPILMYSALSGRIAQLNGFEAGADEYLTKPFAMNQLMERIETLLQSEVTCRRGVRLTESS